MSGDPTDSGAATEPTLRLGDDNPDAWVEYLQKLLLGTDGQLKVDGHFGDPTHQAVITFQRTRGLVTDGVVGNQTWAALREEAPRQAGTDGREAHTFQERGVEARWYTERDVIVHLPMRDQVEALAISTGDSVIEGDTFYSQFVIEGPHGTIRDAGWGRSFEGGAVEVGALFVFVLSEFKQTNGPGEYRATVTMPPELGGDECQGSFTVE